MPSTKILFTAAAICFLFAFAVPTVAVTVGEDPAADDVVLESTDDRYVSIQDGEIRLDLEALNDRAVTRADDVFAITITDDIERLWIESDVPGVTFYGGDDPTATITESHPLEPSAGTTTGIGVAVDTHEAVSGTGAFTVHVTYEDDESGGSGDRADGTGPDGDDDSDGDDDPDNSDDPDNGDDPDAGNDAGDEPDENDAAERVTLEALTVDPTTLEAGESVTVEATYRNAGDATNQHTAELTVDGTVVASQTVGIEGGETRTVTFEREMQWPGSYDVGVDGAASERVTVQGPAAEISEATVSDAELARGDRTTVSAIVGNPTNEPVERTLELAVDGIVVDTRTVVVRPGAERTVTFERRFDAPGTYDLSISGIDADSVTVSESDPFPVRDRQLSAATTAALAPPLAMGFLLLGVAANRRWAIVSGR